MARKPSGPPPPPVVQRLRVRYAKRHRLRFASGRDLQRTLERGLRRSGLEVAYSAGFHPHPRISYATVAPTGMGSEAEFFDLSLSRAEDLDGLVARMNVALPPDMVVLAIVELVAGAPKLARVLSGSSWEFTFHSSANLAEIRQSIAQFVAAETVEVTRQMKKGPRTFDVRADTKSSHVQENNDALIWSVTLRHGSPLVRPLDLLQALRVCHPAGKGKEDFAPLQARIVCTDQGVLTEDGVLEDALHASQ